MQLTQNVGSRRRGKRSPMHPFQISHIPYHIVPFLCAPVLPGETLTKAMLQSRAVTDPIKNPLCGWWLEHYFFYVKLTDLYEREAFRQMLINPAYDSNTITTAQGSESLDREFFYSGGDKMINFAKLCYRRVVDEYFRDEDETHADHSIIDLASTGRTYSLAKIIGGGWLDSVSLQDDETAVDVPLVDAATTDVLHASEVAAGMRLWEQQKMYGLTELSYEDWLSTFGISAPEEADPHRPELLRYLREWQYPTNTVDPTNGTPRSAVSWSIRDQLSKPRAFDEPGFIFGVSVCRPKTYPVQVQGTATSLLNDWRSWMPALFQGDHTLSKKLVPEVDGPLKTIVADADGYVVDLADLYLYGEHFTNEDRTLTTKNFVNQINAALTNTLYPVDLATIDALFVTSGTNNVRQDGIVSLEIAMNARNPVIDYSPRGGNRSNSTSGGF